MITKNNIANYNANIANESNNIGQKLFAYIANGKNINNRIREKFKKSLIFIGDEGQIYNPLTNTYVGIGQTAYTSTISYIEDAHEKIAALQKMLASSMVSAIYANWSKEDWQEAIPTSAGGETKTGDYTHVANISKKDLPTKIYATNEIVLKGHGDYDPTTRLAATTEYSHITDDNLNLNNADDVKTKNIYDKTYKRLSDVNVHYNYYAHTANALTLIIKKSIADTVIRYSDGVTVSENGNYINYVIPSLGYVAFSRKLKFGKNFTSEGNEDVELTAQYGGSTLDDLNNESDFGTGNPNEWLFGSKAKVVIEPRQNAFATSGITVSLKKGLNRYLYSYTFTNKDNIDGVGNAADTDQYEKKQNVYLTDDQLAALRNRGQSEIYDEEIDPETGTQRVLISVTTHTQDRFNTFVNGLTPVYSDDYIVAPTSTDEFWNMTESYISEINTDNGKYTVNNTTKDIASKLADDNENLKAYYTANVAINKKHQLFKQSANIMTIDDKLTWSYIASAYSYTLNFSKEYTDKQVQKIYRELLGEEEMLIPVTLEQVKVSLPNDIAELDKDSLTWDNDTHTWASNKDTVNESSNSLHKYVLNYSSVFVAGIKLPTLENRLKYDEVNENVSIQDGTDTLNYTVLPWNALLSLSRKIAKTKVDAKNAWLADPNSVTKTNEDFYTYLSNCVRGAISEGFSYTYTLVTIDTVDGTTTTTVQKGLNGTCNDLTNVLFMGPDKTCESEHTDENFDRNVSFNESRGDVNYDVTDTQHGGAPTTDPNGSYGSMGDKLGAGKGSTIPEGEHEATSEHNYGYSGTKYTLPTVYSVVTEELFEALHINNVIDETKNIYEPEWINKTNRDLYAVNTNYVSSNKINLADGIQTLKEVAYILDIITDGWGNQYDPEGNGILLTYTIANNHERIEDHEKRLRALEGGKNIVKSIYREARTTSKFVNMHFESDTSWAHIKDGLRIDFDTIDGIATPKNHAKWQSTTNFPLETGKEYYGIYFEPHALNPFNNTGETLQVAYAVPQSYIHSYILRMNAYNAHNNLGNHYEGYEKMVRPEFSDFYGTGAITPGSMTKTDGDDGKFTPYTLGYTEIEGRKTATHEVTDKPFEAYPISFVEVEYNAATGEISYFKDLTGAAYGEDSGYWQVPTYVGQVGIGIDLNVATTYTSTIFCEGDVDGKFEANTPGFEPVDLNSDFIKKNAKLTVYLPEVISYTYIDANNKDVVPEGNRDYAFTYFAYTAAAAPMVNAEHFRFTKEEIDELNNVDSEGNTLAAGTGKYPNLQTIDFTEKNGDETPKYSSDYKTADKELFETLEDLSTDAVSAVSMLKQYSKDIAEYIKNFKNIQVLTLEFKSISNAEFITGVRMEMELSIYDSSTSVNRLGYRQEIYELVDGKIQQVGLNPTDVKSWSTTALPHNLLIRRAPQVNVKQVITDDTDDALTSVDWVTTYVSHVVDDVKRQIKGIEIESYQFTKSLFERLDSSYITSYGMYVAGIKQVNGIVTPIVRQLPQDTISANAAVWGETESDVTEKNYVAVNTNDIENEIALDEKLYVIDGVTYTEIGVHENAKFFIESNAAFGAEILLVSLTGEDADKQIVYFKDTNGIKPVYGSERCKKVKFSIIAGKDYAHFIQCYIQRDRYIQIDSADLKKVNTAGEGETPVYDWQISIIERDIDGNIIYEKDGENNPTTTPKSKLCSANTGDIYKLSATKPSDKKEYISASVSYQSDSTDGVGGNSFKVTAHITKISDASETNSGLVDAYDVKNTFDNMFEWIDLSRWDEDNDGPTNPVNTAMHEEFTNASENEAMKNIQKTKATGNSQLGYPRMQFNPKPVAAGGTGTGEESGE